MSRDPLDPVPADVMDMLDAGLSISDASTDGRARLLQAVRGPGKYAPFTADLARHFDLAPARILELYMEVGDATRWEDGPLPGVRVLHFDGGPQAVAQDAGFVRLRAGFRFPYHRHLGCEVNYVLEGALHDSDGTLYLPGEAVEHGPGTAHEFTVSDRGDVLIGVVHGGFDLIPKP